MHRLRDSVSPVCEIFSYVRRMYFCLFLLFKSFLKRHLTTKWRHRFCCSFCEAPANITLKLMFHATHHEFRLSVKLRPVSNINKMPWLKTSPGASVYIEDIGSQCLLAVVPREKESISALLVTLLQMFSQYLPSTLTIIVWS